MHVPEMFSDHGMFIFLYALMEMYGGRGLPLSFQRFFFLFLFLLSKLNVKQN